MIFNFGCSITQIKWILSPVNNQQLRYREWFTHFIQKKIASVCQVVSDTVMMWPGVSKAITGAHDWHTIGSHRKVNIENICGFSVAQTIVAWMDRKIDRALNPSQVTGAISTYYLTQDVILHSATSIYTVKLPSFLINLTCNFLWQKIFVIVSFKFSALSN